MSKYDIERLLHQLVIGGYLIEKMQLNNEITCAYVYLGARAEELLNSKIKVYYTY